jgi:hypothetical protein
VIRGTEVARATAAYPKNANDHERNGARTSGVTNSSSRSSSATRALWPQRRLF